ncbi:DUF1656 domain-containing protein [Carnimonas bestiolae]|uniref:DUF1656 domain-containing protein n=1 Tax=Carnimonas bestiolae TaxID=3402172 RepID=UPI003EDBCFD3
MPREVMLGDALAPGLLVLFVASLLLMWGIDKLAARYGVYHYVWHPGLFRLALFTSVFALIGLVFF